VTISDLAPTAVDFRLTTGGLGALEGILARRMLGLREVVKTRAEVEAEEKRLGGLGVKLSYVGVVGYIISRMPA
jgi:hypothetical protein